MFFTPNWPDTHKLAEDLALVGLPVIDDILESYLHAVVEHKVAWNYLKKVRAQQPEAGQKRQHARDLKAAMRDWESKLQEEGFYTPLLRGLWRKYCYEQQGGQMIQWNELQSALFTAIFQGEQIVAQLTQHQADPDAGALLPLARELYERAKAIWPRHAPNWQIDWFNRPPRMHGGSIRDINFQRFADNLEAEEAAA